MEIKSIEPLVVGYADAHRKLSDLVKTLEDELQAVKKTHLRAIKDAVGRAKERKSVLETAIKDSSSLFDAPRTRIMHGVKFGLQKQKGTIQYADEDKVIELIKKHLPEQKDLLIKPVEKLLKAGLGDLAVVDLKRIGVSITAAGDAVLIKVVDGDVEKLVADLLKDSPTE